MKTAEAIIEEIQELAPDQKNIVIDYVNSIQDEKDADFLNRALEEEYVEEENYSPEDIAKLNRAQEDAKKGINMSGPFHTTEEIFAHLDSLKQEQ